MESSVAPVPHRTYRFLLHHLCSSFDREPRVSLATPAVIQELLLRTEPGQVCAQEKPPEKVETSLMLGDVFDGIDLQNASVGSRDKDIFDEFDLMMNDSEDVVPENYANIFEALVVTDYDGDVGMFASVYDMAKQPLDSVQNIVEKLSIADEVQVDLGEGDKMVSENIGKAEEVVSSVVLETSNETLERDMELEKPVNTTQVLGDSVSRIIEDDDVEEGEISGDDNDDMAVGDDLPGERHEEFHVSQEGTGNSYLKSQKSFGSLSTPETVDEIGKKLGVEVSDVDHRTTKNDQSFINEEKMDLGTSIKKRSAPRPLRKQKPERRQKLGRKELKSV